MTAPADCPICCPAGWSPNVDQVPDEDCPAHGRRGTAAANDYMPPVCPDCREHDDGTTTCNPAMTLCPLNGAIPSTDAKSHTAIGLSPMPKPTHTRIRSVRVPEPLWEAAKAKAAERGETVTDVVVKALERYVKRP